MRWPQRAAELYYQYKTSLSRFGYDALVKIFRGDPEPEPRPPLDNGLSGRRRAPLGTRMPLGRETLY